MSNLCDVYVYTLRCVSFRYLGDMCDISFFHILGISNDTLPNTIGQLNMRCAFFPQDIAMMTVKRSTCRILRVYGCLLPPYKSYELLLSKKKKKKSLVL